ncbi:MAG TPA: hypothetical protein VM657_00840 [Sphingomonas sp.]|nr:hypothetical protein [Sphingomonas sp.]
MDELAQAINIQLAAAVRAPVPFAVAVLLAAIVVWRILAWRYSSQIEILKHRLELREDTIGKYERGGSLPQVTIEENHAKSSKVEQDRLDIKIESFASKNQQYLKEFDYNLLPSSITVETLRDIYRDKTEIQADRLASIYIGKWIEVSGKVSNVTSHGEDKVNVSLKAGKEAVELETVWMSFEGDKESLEILRIDDVVVVHGKIKKFGRFDVNLENCILVKAT